MTPEEIRSIGNKWLAIHEEAVSKRDTAGLQACIDSSPFCQTQMLVEIAAQLAELNITMKKKEDKSVFDNVFGKH